MITATIVVFIAIFGGMAILGLMIWLISRKNRGNFSSNNFVGGLSSTGEYGSHHSETTENEDSAFVDNSYYEDGKDELKASASASEYVASAKNASETSTNTETYKSVVSQNDYSAPAADYSYSDSSSYDSGGSSYDSSSSDSSSSSSSD